LRRFHKHTRQHDLFAILTSTTLHQPENDLSELNLPLTYRRSPSALKTAADQTRRIYDMVASVYPVSTMLFHSDAHRCLLKESGIRDGTRILEVATGSGEMFRRLVRANPTGQTFGLDLSPNMAAKTQREVRRDYPGAQAHCKAVDVRHMPFRDGSFDAVVCCYLFELLGDDDIALTLREIRRVLRDDGAFSMVLISQRRAYFNGLYKICGGLVPAFWGRQVERDLPGFLESASMEVVRDRPVAQSFYPSRVLVARKRLHSR
jgi:ubiquinone/menaquinone biosynthesis C-methylase UbiE